MDKLTLKIIAVVILFCVIMVFAVKGMLTTFLGANTVKSSTRIEPKIELIINNNQVDTLFVYELNKN